MSLSVCIRGTGSAVPQTKITNRDLESLVEKRTSELVAEKATSERLLLNVNSPEELLQAATMLSLLTPEYRRRMVQQNYHEGVNNAPQWMASFCYPEGFMRWWAEASLGGDIELTMTPNQVQFLSGIAGYNAAREMLKWLG